MMDTSVSLLERLQTAGGPEAWNRLIDLYAPLLRVWTLRFDVPETDADDLSQEVLLTVSREIRRFEHSGRTGAFRAWLRTILIHRIRDFWKSRQHHLPGRGGSTWAERLNELVDDTSDASREWDREHDELVMARLLEQIRPRFEPKTWDAFHRQVFGGDRADVVAADLQMTLNSVYVARSRILRVLRREAAGLIGD